MVENGISREPIGRLKLSCIGAGVVICLSQICGCPYFSLFCGSYSDKLVLHGKLIDSDTGAPLQDLPIGGRSFTDGEETYHASAFTVFGTLNGPPTAEDGSFDKEFRSSVGSGCDPPVFPRPDQVEVIVVREACVRRFLIDINEETVVDLDFPDGVIELKQPLLFEPCAE